ncbi:hypothetical protein T492DRAFT_380248 [Pavlovales sp. CCMP2436]|nr:hypothetical protein T492DRAFT_380248 [Pavlovales sp. CCMP2436]
MVLLLLYPRDRTGRLSKTQCALGRGSRRAAQPLRARIPRDQRARGRFAHIEDHRGRHGYRRKRLYPSAHPQRVTLRPPRTRAPGLVRLRRTGKTPLTPGCSGVLDCANSPSVRKYARSHVGNWYACSSVDNNCLSFNSGLAKNPATPPRQKSDPSGYPLRMGKGAPH